jgi:hypothetical protein
MGDVLAIIIVPAVHGLAYGMLLILVASRLTLVFRIMTCNLDYPKTLQEAGAEKSNGRAPPGGGLSPALI